MASSRQNPALSAHPPAHQRPHPHHDSFGPLAYGGATRVLFGAASSYSSPVRQPFVPTNFALSAAVLRPEPGHKIYKNLHPSSFPPHAWPPSTSYRQSSSHPAFSTSPPSSFPASPTSSRIDASPSNTTTTTATSPPPPAKLSPGDPNPLWLEAELFGPAFGTWDAEIAVRKVGDGKRKRGSGDGEEGEEEDPVGNGLDWMASAASDSLTALCVALRKVCANDKELQRVAQELEDLLRGLRNESALSTVSAGLSTLSASSSHGPNRSPLQLLLLAHPREALAVFAEVFKQALKGLNDRLGEKLERAELVGDEKERVEGWEGVVEEVERACEIFLDDEDDRPHQVTDEEKEQFSVCFVALAGLLRLDPEVRKLRPSLLRRVFDIFSAATAHHTPNKIRLTQMSTLGPYPLSQILFAASDEEVTAQALELAFRLGDHVGRIAKDQGVKERWTVQIFPNTMFGKKFGETCRGLFSGLTVGTYEEKSPALLALLSQRSADCYFSLPCRRLNYADRTFSLSNARPAAAAEDQDDGRVSVNRATLTACVVEKDESEGDGDMLERVLELRWDEVERVLVLPGSGIRTAKIRLLKPPTLDGQPLLANGGNPLVKLVLKTEDLKAFVSTLRRWNVSIPVSRSTPASGITAPRAVPPTVASSATKKASPAPWDAGESKVGSAPPLSLRGEKAKVGSGALPLPRSDAQGAGVAGDEAAGKGKKRQIHEGPGKAGVQDLFSPAEAVTAKKPRLSPSTSSLRPAQKAGIVPLTESQGQEAQQEEGVEGMEEVQSLLQGLSEDRRKELVRELLKQETGVTEEGLGGQDEDLEGKVEGEGVEVERQGDALEPVPFGSHTIDPLPAAGATLKASEQTAPSGATIHFKPPIAAPTFTHTVKSADTKKEPQRHQQGEQPDSTAKETVDLSLDEKEQAVSSVLADLSSVILQCFSSRTYASTTFLNREQAVLTGKVTRTTDELFRGTTFALLSLSTTAQTAHSRFAEERTLPALRACGERSREGVERVKEGFKERARGARE
ncbi:hypothetical protein JCM11251_002844 [Rhodosporidiobolus azoricus]